MIYIVYIAADVLVGGIVFGMVSSNRVRKEFTSRIEESGYRANILERNAAALGGSIKSCALSTRRLPMTLRSSGVTLKLRMVRWCEQRPSLQRWCNVLKRRRNSLRRQRPSSLISSKQSPALPSIRARQRSLNWPRRLSMRSLSTEMVILASAKKPFRCCLNRSRNLSNNLKYIFAPSKKTGRKPIQAFRKI